MIDTPYILLSRHEGETRCYGPFTSSVEADEWRKVNGWPWSAVTILPLHRWQVVDERAGR
jgi:hypothetical protein